MILHKSVKGLALWAIAFVGLEPGMVAAQASGPYVTCVQNQLASSGFDPGPIDGLMGRRTRAALANWKEENEGGEALPRLDSRTAITWCRTLADTSTALRRHRPSHDPFTLYQTSGASWVFRKTVERAAKNAILFYQRELDLEIASHVDIILGTDPQQIYREQRKIMRARGRPLIANLRSAKRLCDFENSWLGAFASVDQIIVCVSPDTVTDMKWSERWQGLFTVVLVHEWFHHIQRELTTEKSGRPTRAPLMWPAWFIEGSANHFERVLTQRDFLMPDFQAVSQSKATLAGLRASGQVIEPHDYDLSELAVWVLVQRHGIDSLLQYFQEVGRRGDAQGAFRTIFGMDVRSYERAFEKLRRDKDALTDYAVPLKETE